MSIMDLIKCCNELGLQSSDLDALVFSLSPVDAGIINEGGFEHQVVVLYCRYGDAAIHLLKGLARERAISTS